MSTKNNILTPVGRLVMGDLYKPQTTDADGKPRVVKQGPNAGQPNPQFFFALAIPKTPGVAHWASEPWGKIIWETGHASFPQGQAQHPTFAWKIVDGDSNIKNRNGAGIAPNTREGYPGHWVLSFASTYAPKLYNADGTQQFTEPGRVKIGHYVQVAGSVAGNESTQSPGIFLNHQAVAFQAFGPEISTGIDAASVGFGQGVTLPAGASAAPLGGFNPAPSATPTPGSPAAPMPSTPSAPAVPIQPNPAFLQAPAVASVAAAPASASAATPAVPVPAPVIPVPLPAGRQMTAKANGLTREQFVSGGWTDEALVREGYMTP